MGSFERALNQFAVDVEQHVGLHDTLGRLAQALPKIQRAREVGMTWETIASRLHNPRRRDDSVLAKPITAKTLARYVHALEQAGGDAAAAKDALHTVGSVAVQRPVRQVRPVLPIPRPAPQAATPREIPSPVAQPVPPSAPAPTPVEDSLPSVGQVDRSAGSDYSKTLDSLDNFKPREPIDLSCKTIFDKGSQAPDAEAPGEAPARPRLGKLM